MAGRIVLGVLFTILSFACSGRTWFKGSLTLRSESVLRGEISIQDGYDVVLFKIGDEIEVIPAFKIAFMNLFDEDEKIVRRFISLYVGIGPARAFQFFEVIVDGEISVLRKQLTAWYAVNRDITSYDYYILYNSQLLDITRFKRKVYPHIVKETDGALEQYIHERKLAQYKLDDVIAMIAFYNAYQADHLHLAKN